MMSGSKAPDYDTCGLLRTTCSHNPTQHSHIVVLTPHFYAHIGAGHKVILPLVQKFLNKWTIFLFCSILFSSNQKEH